jgi:hypothetical protein
MSDFSTNISAAFPSSWADSVREGIAHEDRILALGAGGNQRHRGFDQFLDALDVFDRLGGQIGPAERAPAVVPLQPSISS